MTTSSLAQFKCWQKLFFFALIVGLFSFNLPSQKAEANARTLGIVGTALGGTALGLSALNSWALYRNGAFSQRGLGGGFYGAPGYASGVGYYAPAATDFGYAGYPAPGNGYYGYGGGYYSPSYYGGYMPGSPAGCGGGAPISACGCAMAAPVMAPPVMAAPCCQPAPVMAAPPCGCASSFGMYR